MELTERQAAIWARCKHEILRLARENVHPRDARVLFDEKRHQYFVDYETKGWISVTGLVHLHFPPFKARQVAEEQAQNPRSEHFGRPENLLAQWERGRELGTKMHRNLELAINSEMPGTVEAENQDAWEQFLHYHQTVTARGWVPFRTEMIIFAEDLRLAGSVDMLYRDPQGALIVVDWKRSKNIWYKGWDGARALNMLSHLDACNGYEYQMQVNFYRAILEQYYGYSVSAMRFVTFHPSQGGFHEHIVDLLDQEVDAVFALRRAEVRLLTLTGAPPESPPLQSSAPEATAPAGP